MGEMSPLWKSMGGPLSGGNLWRLYVARDFTVADLDHIKRHIDLAIECLQADDNKTSVCVTSDDEGTDQ